MVGHIGAKATAAIGIVSSSTWLLHGILVDCTPRFRSKSPSTSGLTASRMPGACCGSPCSSTSSWVWALRLSASASAASCPGGWGRTSRSRPVPAPTSPSVGGPPLHDGHGDVRSHAPRHRRRPDAQPHQRAGLRAGCGVQLLPHQSHPADPALRPERHSLGCRP